MRALYAIPILLAAACYHPKIADGAFLCGQGQSCPEGFSCAADNHCRLSGGQGGDLATLSDLGVDLAGDMATLPTFVGSGALGPLDLTGMTGELDVNTENGQMVFVAGIGDGGTGTTVVPVNAMGFQNRAQPSGGPHVGIWNFSQIVIPKGVTVKPSSQSQSVMVLASTGDLTLAGNIDFRLFGGFGGLAGMAGASRSSGVASGGGGAPNDGTGAGGGGAGYPDPGKSGAGSGGGMGGAIYGSATLVPIHTGSGGGGGGSALVDGGAALNPAGAGGAGGGAVALFGASVTISGTIDVRGSDGKSALPTASLPAGGGGGGSGGSILVSGISVVLNSGHDLFAAGGKGGTGTLGDGGNTGNAGGDGSPGRIWIGSLNLTGSVQSDTPAVLGGANSSVKTFPR